MQRVDRRDQRLLGRQPARRVGCRGRLLHGRCAPEDAIVATASQLQDHAIEATGGSALPACPGHPHPLSARVLDGIAQWVCPKDPTHHREPVLTAGQRPE